MNSQERTVWTCRNQMNSRPMSLMDVLQPRYFQNNPKRAEVTRTILQPEIDLFEQREADGTETVGLLPEPANAKRAPARWSQEIMGERS